VWWAQLTGQLFGTVITHCGSQLVLSATRGIALPPYLAYTERRKISVHPSEVEQTVAEVSSFETRDSRLTQCLKGLEKYIYEKWAEILLAGMKAK